MLRQDSVSGHRLVDKWVVDTLTWSVSYFTTGQCLRTSASGQVSSRHSNLVCVVCLCLVSCCWSSHIIHQLTHCCVLFDLFVCRFLKILQVIVLEPTASFRTFLPTILNICLYHVCPVLTQVSFDHGELCVYVC